MAPRPPLGCSPPPTSGRARPHLTLWRASVSMIPATWGPVPVTCAAVSDSSTSGRGGGGGGSGSGAHTALRLSPSLPAAPRPSRVGPPTGAGLGGDDERAAGRLAALRARLVLWGREQAGGGSKGEAAGGSAAGGRGQGAVSSGSRGRLAPLPVPPCLRPLLPHPRIQLLQERRHVLGTHQHLGHICSQQAAGVEGREGGREGGRGTASYETTRASAAGRRRAPLAQQPRPPPAPAPHRSRGPRLSRTAGGRPAPGTPH